MSAADGTDGIAGPERRLLAPGLEISRIVTGLWQVADIERASGPLDPEAAADVMQAYAGDGYDTFDMADHYGSAELVTGALLRRPIEPRPTAFTKWCPEPGAMTPEVVRAGVQERLDRLGVERIDLLQLHWWSFEHPGYLDAVRELDAMRREGLIGRIGVTNFDTDHLRVLVKHGFEITTNQVCLSPLDRRALGEMSGFCAEHAIGLLAYGTLAGGFLSERWLGAAEPVPDDWSKMKYRRFIEAAGGWQVLQGVLQALGRVARRHGASIANVAIRWALDQPAVAAVIVGARLGEREHRADNAKVGGLRLDEEDRERIDAALAATTPIPGDCGDEYRRPPFLTASGDLSHHLGALPPVYRAITDGAGRQRIDSGSVWEGLAGYARAVRVGDRILVSGTTATHGHGELVCPGDVRGQTIWILDKIAAAIGSLGGRLEDVVRTRIYLRDADQWEPVARAHGRYFASIRPANTLIEVSRLVGDYAVEIEAEAILQHGRA